MTWLIGVNVVDDDLDDSYCASMVMTLEHAIALAVLMREDDSVVYSEIRGGTCPLADELPRLETAIRLGALVSLDYDVLVRVWLERHRDLVLGILGAVPEDDVVCAIDEGYVKDVAAKNGVPEPSDERAHEVLVGVTAGDGGVSGELEALYDALDRCIMESLEERKDD